MTLKASGGKLLPPSTITPGEMVCVRLETLSGGKGGYAPTCVRGKVHSLGGDGCTLDVALETRFGDPAFSQLVGKMLRLERISQLADATTYEVRTGGQGVEYQCTGYRG